MKTCTLCFKEKPEEAFYRRKEKLLPYCKVCMKDWQREKSKEVCYKEKKMGNFLIRLLKESYGFEKPLTMPNAIYQPRAGYVSFGHGRTMKTRTQCK